MTRINTNVNALIAQNNLKRTNLDLNTRLERLSTGLQINRGADDPSGLIISEALRAEIASIDQAINNAERAVNVIATTEAALQEVSALLIDIQGLVIESSNTGGLSKEEIEANQLQIDSAVESITRISSTTSFAGLKLLNGSLDYHTSGIDSTAIQDVKVFRADLGTADSVPVTVEVLNSAQTAQLFISGNTAGSPGALLSSVSFEVQGNKGSEVFQFVSGTALSAVAFALNQVAAVTGVSATLVDPSDQTSGLVLSSTEYGSDAFVSVRKIETETPAAFFQTFDELAAAGGTPRAVNRDTGEDVLSLINGSLAVGDGTEVSLRSSTLNIELNLTVDAAQITPPFTGVYTFSVTGGGSSFQIGANVNPQENVGFGIQSVAASHLGSDAVGFLNSIVDGGNNSVVGDNAAQASEIVDLAIQQIATLRGRLGAFERNTLQTSIRSHQIALENLTASESQIRDADFAAETSELTRAQILASAGTSTLALANSQAQQVLSLLG